MPFDRYSSIGIRRDKNTDNRRLKSSIPVTVNPTSSDIYIMSRAGDRLDNLAYVYYKDATMWPIIASANKLGKGTLEVPPGIQIRIPADSTEVVKQWRISNSGRR